MLHLVWTKKQRLSAAQIAFQTASGKARRDSACLLRHSSRSAQLQKCSQLFVSSR